MSSRIILENNEGRIGMGFDASEVGRDPDAERLLRSSYSPSMNYEVRRLQEMLRSSGIDRRLASFQGSIAHGVARSVAPNLARSMAQSVTPNSTQSMARSMAQIVARSMAPNSAQSMAQSMAQIVAPSLARSVTPSMAGSIESLRSAAMSSLSSSIMQSFEVHGLDPAHSASWSLRRAPSVRTPALQSFLKSATAFGPIVISPDDEDDAPFDYHPDLQGWRVPETATESGDAIDDDELWAEMVAFVMGIARHHRTEALVRGVGKHGVTLLITVAGGALGETVGQAIWYWLTHR